MDCENQIEEKIESKVGVYFYKGFKMLAIACFALAFIALVGYAMMLLWNWLMTDLFGLRELNYWEAVGLLLLAKIIFGFGGGGSKKGSRKRHKFNSKKWSPKKRSSEQIDDWAMYDRFWEEEGKQAYESFVEKNKPYPHT